MITSSDTNTLQTVFRSRRLGHANMFVSDYERLFDFYNRVAGFEEVYRQPDNRASFISNGNTYHDMALTDVASKYAGVGRSPGLFHIAFEVENEVDLVDGYHRALQAGVRFTTTEDHDVAHSLYTSDPDGNGVELYADVVADWRSARRGAFNKTKPKWVPGVTTVPVADSRYPVDPEIRVVPDALFHPRKVAHVCLVAGNFEAMFDYYTKVIGLDVVVGARAGEFAALHGTSGEEAVSLIRKTASTSAGLHHIGIEVLDERSLEQSIQKAAGANMDVVKVVDHPARRSVFIVDPDGALLQFYVNRRWSTQALEGLDARSALDVL